jgi:hypothetical protein
MQPQLLLVLVCMALASTALIMWACTPEQRDNHSSYCSGETGSVVKDASCISTVGEAAWRAYTKKWAASLCV